MKLREPFQTLVDDIYATVTARGRESRSDMEPGLHALVQKYEITLRPIPLERSEIEHPPSTCPVCRKPNNGAVKSLGRDSAGEEIHCHTGCIFFAHEAGKEQR